MDKDILKYTNNNKIIAIGETGLDYHYNTENKLKQKRNFEIHIEACRKTGLPLIVHTRDADKDMINILESEMKNGEFDFVLHCFSSSKELAYRSLDIGGFISFSGIVTFKNASDLQEIAKTIPIDRIFIETDAPYLAPVPLRGKENQPAYIKYTAEEIAKLREISIDELTQITTSNAEEILSI